MRMNEEVVSLGANRAAKRSQKREAWLTGQNEAFKAAVNGARPEESLEILISTAIDQVPGTSRCAFYIANEKGTELSHLVGMPQTYADKVQAFKIGSDSLACGLAVGTAEPVITADVRDDPRWKPWLWLAEEYGYRGCWSFPVETSRGKLIGTFAMYFTEPRSPAHEDLDLAQSLCRTASIIIAQNRARRAEETLRDGQKLLLTELQHRVRNTLAVVRSIARRTADNSSSVEEMISHFQGRLDAFSRVQAKLTRRPDNLVDITSLIEDEMIAHAAREGDQVRIKGPELSLKPRLAERLSLAVHELATNAVKHGALGADHGKVSIAWQVQRESNGGLLFFEWEESGVSVEKEPEREGFGMDLLRRSLPYDLGAETKVEFGRHGLRFELRMPLEGMKSSS